MPTVCLIIPPSPFLLDERVFPPLGILKVAAALEAAHVPVEALDLSGVDNYIEAVRDHAAATRADVFGVTATTPQMPGATRIARALRETRADAHLVLGGPHATLMFAAARRGCGRAVEACVKLLEVWDQIVAGDGEKAVLRAIAARREPVVSADDPASPFFLLPQELGLLPARHLIDLSTYHYKIDGAPATSLIAQLGCPFQCNFCSGRHSPSFRRLRSRATPGIVAEVEQLHRAYGYTGFMFYDDEINVSKSMVPLMQALADLQARLGVDFRLRGFIKAELFTDEQARAMYTAGFRWILAGFESGSPRILDNIDKKATVADNNRCVEIARRAGLKVKALMSLGHAGESPATCRETEDWLLRTAPDDFDVTIITVYPGSAYHDDATPSPPGVHTFTHPRTGDRLHALDIDYTEVADYYKGDPQGGYKSYVFTDYMAAEEIVEHRGRIDAAVRAKLGIPWNPSGVRMAHRHDGGALPPYILRRTPT